MSSIATLFFVWEQGGSKLPATHLSRASLERALDHICAYGDTDVFPHLGELHFLRDKRDEVLSELSVLDINSYQPLQAVEVLAPKSRFGFRIVHQLHFVDTILFTAAVIEIGEELENLKSSEGNSGPFAYRFDATGGKSLFQSGHTFRDWLIWQKSYAEKADFDYVVFSDIADFYQRIYLHRIESLLDVATAKKGVKHFIERVIKAIRSRQSYGIPVGGSASRVLAEAALSDSDAALLDEGIAFTRFVDDFRLYVASEQVPYQVLSFLAEQLFLTEGLTLNGKKTSVMTKEAYLAHLEAELPGEDEKAEDAALETLTHDIYFSEEEPDEDKIAALKAMNMVAALEESVAVDDWDFGRIKSILRALRLVKSADATDSVIRNMHELLPFAKEVMLYFDELDNMQDVAKENLKNTIVSLASDKSAKNVPIIHAWLLEFFVRGVTTASHKELQAMEASSPLSDRQINIIRGRNGDVNFFRRNKTRFEELSPLTKYSFILGASCLPRGEYEAWIGAIKGRMRGPLEGLYCDWAKSKVGQIASILDDRMVGQDLG